MGWVDADAHVIECDRTWDFMDEADRRWRPIPVTAVARHGRFKDSWHIDGNIYSRHGGNLNLDLELRDLSNVEGRLRIMDRLGVDIQVLFPTFFLQGLPSRLPEVHLALTKAYNRWLGDVYERSDGRLRWVIVPPIETMSATLAELEWGKAHGACGVFMRGIEGDRVLNDPYFYPLYEKARDLNLPICIHAGNGNNDMKSVLFQRDLYFFGVTPVLAAFNLLVTSGIPEKFQGLRIGFIEAGAGWVPYLVREAARRHEAIGTPGEIKDETTALRDKNLFVACRTDDDLEYILRFAGKGNLLIGTDFGHEDPAAELDALENLRKAGKVNPSLIDRILGDNPRTFFGL